MSTITSQPVQTRCPTGKIRYRTRHDADRVLTSMLLQNTLHDTSRLHAYQCRSCQDGWHIGNSRWELPLSERAGR